MHDFLSLRPSLIVDLREFTRFFNIKYKPQHYNRNSSAAIHDFCYDIVRSNFSFVFISKSGFPVFS